MECAVRIVNLFLLSYYLLSVCSYLSICSCLNFHERCSFGWLIKDNIWCGGSWVLKMVTGYPDLVMVSGMNLPLFLSLEFKIYSQTRKRPWIIPFSWKIQGSSLLYMIIIRLKFLYELYNYAFIYFAWVPFLSSESTFLSLPRTWSNSSRTSFIKPTSTLYNQHYWNSVKGFCNTTCNSTKRVRISTNLYVPNCLAVQLPLMLGNF